MAIVIKPLSRADMEQAALVHRKSFDERLPWLAGLHTPEEDRAFFQDVVYDRAQSWGCFERSELVAFIAFQDRHVEHLYVLPGRQRLGLGTLLLSLAKERCLQLDLWTFRQNAAARRFYERNGFIAVEESDGSRNEENEPDVRYRWQRR